MGRKDEKEIQRHIGEVHQRRSLAKFETGRGIVQVLRGIAGRKEEAESVESRARKANNSKQFCPIQDKQAT